jgi:hypothetical protein
MPGIKTSPSKNKVSPAKGPNKKGKGRASSSPSKVQESQPSPPLEAAGAEEDDNELLNLANQIAENAHLLVRGRGDETLEERARQVVKRSFDRGECSTHCKAVQLSLTVFRYEQHWTRNPLLSLTFPLFSLLSPLPPARLLVQPLGKSLKNQQNQHSPSLRRRFLN